MQGVEHLRYLKTGRQQGKLRTVIRLRIGERVGFGGNHWEGSDQGRK